MQYTATYSSCQRFRSTSYIYIYLFLFYTLCFQLCIIQIPWTKQAWDGSEAACFGCGTTGHTPRAAMIPWSSSGRQFTSSFLQALQVAQTWAAAQSRNRRGEQDMFRACRGVLQPKSGRIQISSCLGRLALSWHSTCLFEVTTLNPKF